MITATMKRFRVVVVIAVNKILGRLDWVVQMVVHAAEVHPARMESEQAQATLTTYLLLVI
jgi:hypothetical protein